MRSDAVVFWGMVLVALPGLSDAQKPGKVVFVEEGVPRLVREEGTPWIRGDGYIECTGQGNFLVAGQAVGAGDFHLYIKLSFQELKHTAASFALDFAGPERSGSHFGFDGGDTKLFYQGPLFGKGTRYVEDSAGLIEAGKPFEFEVIRKGSNIDFLMDGTKVHSVETGSKRLGPIALRPWRSTMRVFDFWAEGRLDELPALPTQPRGYSIPIIDISHQKERQIVVESIPGQYLGHPTTLLMPDNKTLFVAYPLGHGGPAAVLKKSTDGGLTWSERLPVPENWATANNCPCLHRLVGPDGVARLFVFEGNGAMRQSVSLDEGRTWTPFEPNGLHCVVAPITIIPISGRRHLAHYHRGYSEKDRSPLTIWQSISEDGGLTWGAERKVAEFPGADPCEPCIVRSPDGKQLASISRENARRYNSLLIVSDDEGETWSDPVEVPASLTGDRHMARYAHDGRLVMTFRDTAHESPTRGQFVGWVGAYDDLVNLREGQYRIQLLESPTKFDLGYPGLELLPDGTFVTTTYAVLNEGEKNSVVSVRFSLEELDKMAAKLPKQAPVFVSGEEGYHTFRIPAVLVTQKGTVLAFCEGRRKSGADNGDIDLVLKRSMDGGETFGDLQVVWAEEGDITIGNPCPVVDESTGTIWLPFCRDNDRVFVTHSTDDGVTWATPVEIAASVKPENWTWYATGPVHGVQLDTGRLLIPCDHRVKDDKTPYSHVIFSDDHGASWKLGGVLGEFTDECTAVQTTDGSVYLNMRSYHKKNRRAVARSQDGGKTWSEVTLDEALVEPVCQGSVIRFSDGSDGDKARLLFSNPASKERVRMTVRVSYDEGKAWTDGRVLHHGPSAYSDLAVLPDRTVLCLYERGPANAYQTITLARFGIEWIEE